MADKSTHPIEPLSFHPCDTPRGMEYYDLSCLMKVQQQRLNNHKIEVLRENQKYLFRNPEIRGVLQVIMRKILIERPSHDIELFIGNYFAHNWQSISEEVNRYVEALSGKPTVGESKIETAEKHVTMDDRISDEVFSSSVTSSVDEYSTNMFRDILDELLDKVQELHQQGAKRVQTADTTEILEDKHKRGSEKSDDEDDLIFDLGLEFDLDFSTYHEEDDTNVV